MNENLATGEIEVLRDRIFGFWQRLRHLRSTLRRILRPKKRSRLKYRYLDLRRPDMQRNLMMRSKVATLTRQFLAEEGFLEIETPILIEKYTGRRTEIIWCQAVYIQGHFYALPQSPQLFKQLLMCSGCDRYFQLARCFRDEDLRADRQPEFTQIDMELSFVDVDDVIEVNERLLAQTVQRSSWRRGICFRFSV